MMNQRGFTLLEVFLATAISSALLAVLLTTFITGRRAHLTAEEFLLTQEQARRALDVMTLELRGAGQVRDPRLAGAGNTDFTDAPRLDFQIIRTYDTANPSCPNGLCWGDGVTDGHWLHYLLNAGNPANVQLVRCSTANQLDNPLTAGTCRVLANHVQIFAIAYVHGTRQLRVSLQIRRTNPQLPGGSMQASPVTIVAQTQLRNFR